MPTTPRTGLPYFWVTWVTSLLAGEACCEYAPWFRARHKYDKRPRDLNLSAWQLAHTALMEQTVGTLTADGWSVTREDQNAFRLTGTTAILAGKPDLVARKDREHVRVIDCKTGQPSTRDVVQVGIYLIVLPLVWQRPHLAVEGTLVYPTHTQAVTAAEAALIRDRLFALLRKLGTQASAPPPTVPSQRECDWCDIAACPDRWTAADAPAMDVATVSF